MTDSTEAGEALLNHGMRALAQERNVVIWLDGLTEPVDAQEIENAGNSAAITDAKGITHVVRASRVARVEIGPKNHWAGRFSGQN